MKFLTDFADQAVLLPVALLFAASLGVLRWWRGLAAWLAAVIGVLGAMALLKYICFACAAPLAFTGVRSPSGHTAASTMIYGGGLALLLRGRVPRVGWAALPFAMAGLFGASRIAVGAHDWQEVLAGAAVGLAGAGALLVLAGLRPPMRTVWVAAAVLLLAMGLHVTRLNAETMIHTSSLLTWLPLPAACRDS